MKTAGLSTKNTLRKHYLSVRQKIVREAPTPHFSKAHALILSYASFNSEFPTDQLNQILAEENRLILPKVVGEELHLYRPKHLIKNKWGILEPIPSPSQKVHPEDISLALIPALAFDTHNHRLGYGKGYYDRLVPKLSLAYGLGYTEQLHTTPLPTTEKDCALHGLLLF